MKAENNFQYPQSDSFIQCCKLCKAYNEQLIVMDNLDFEMNSQERLVVIGPSGGGKSSLLRVLMGLEGIQSGQINFQGIPYIQGTNDKNPQTINSKLQRQIGMVFQHYTLFPHLSVLNNLILSPVKVLRKSKKEAIEQARKLLSRLGLENKLNSYPSQLSGGQKQRIAIARALMLEPKLMLFDEVTSALDPEIVIEVQDVIIELAEQNMTMILVTHDMYFAREIATRVIFLECGKIIEDGKPEEIFTNPNCARTRNFLNKVGHFH